MSARIEDSFAVPMADSCGSGSRMVNEEAPAECQPASLRYVGEQRHSRMTDDEREAAIQRAGLAMEKAYADYLRSGCFADAGRAHHHLWQMGKLIEGRSPEMVARLEQERGLTHCVANEAKEA